MQSKKSPTILIAPNAFKGTLTSEQACSAIHEGFKQIIPDATYHLLPLADGGTGSSHIAAHIHGGVLVEKEVLGPEGTPVKGFYYLSGKMAWIEVAAASGFSLLKEPKANLSLRSSFGTGELISHALESGASEITLFLGDSATTDGGVGILKALGFKFLSKTGLHLPSLGESRHRREPFPGDRLNEIGRIIPPASGRLSNAKFTVVTDVSNPLFGHSGAALVFGPQKGGTAEEILTLNSGLKHLAAIVEHDCHISASLDRGAGAAGGIGFAGKVFLGGALISGAKYFLDLYNFDSLLQHTDFVVTGEGIVDPQSLTNKLLGEILSRTKHSSRLVVSLCGKLNCSLKELSSYPQLSIHSIFAEDIKATSAESLSSCAKRVAEQLRLSTPT